MRFKVMRCRVLKFSPIECGTFGWNAFKLKLWNWRKKTLFAFTRGQCFPCYFRLEWSSCGYTLLKWFKIPNNKNLQFHFTFLSWSLDWRNSLNNVLCNSLCIYGLPPNNTTLISIWIKFNKKPNLLSILLESLGRSLAPKMCIFCLLI